MIPLIRVAKTTLAFLLFSAVWLATLTAHAADTVSLAGDWRFALDRDNAGVDQQWFTRDLSDKISLPGILQAQGYGDEISATTPWVALLGVAPWNNNPDHDKYSQPGNVKVPFLSQPPRHYVGVAWYQRDITIPPNWQGRRVELFLEHPRWESTVWVDEKKIGSNLSLVAPHVYDLGLLASGRHRLTIRLDTGTAKDPNARDRWTVGSVMFDEDGQLLVYRPDGHSVTDALGEAWNGITGRIELIATTPVWIDDAQVFPSVAQKSALVKITIGNDGGQSGNGTLSIGNVSTPVKWDAQGGSAELEVPLGPDAQTWDEFHPVLQHLTVQLKGDQTDDARALTFGLREVSHDDKELLLNGHEINFRGTHFGGDFPLTGYPPTDVASWKKIIQVCKDYGLNGMRFHSWCPPEAAFEAADELGFYLQPECGMWNAISVNSPMFRMLEAETARILKAYGNHPSFLLLSPSNEPAGGWRNATPEWAAEWYQKDPRRLYAAGTGWDFPEQLQGPQYAVMPHIGGSALRGNAAWFGGDWSAALQDVHIPVLAHELGQWCAYPNYDVIKKFTGYLRPGNFEIFRDSMAAHGLLDRDADFAWASGKFQLACYKEEIEANLRTPGLAGFQLLELHDYLGQGTALIGVLDAFWETKGYVTPAEFRRFCSDTVPLAWLKQRIFTTADTLNTAVDIYQFGPTPLANATPYWKITDSAGKVVAQGSWPSRDIPIGKGIPLGNISADLSKLPAPQAYKLVVGLQGTEVENDWDFWLYPAQITPSATKDVLETPSWEQAAAYLAQGGKVLFIPQASALQASGRNPPLDDVPVFWNRPMNPKLSAMLGLWCDTKSPALAEFPTEAFCNWQWTQIVRGVPAINLDSLPPALTPIVSAIDDWNRNWRLGLIFECKVGPGRLLVCPIDFQYGTAAASPVGQQLQRSLLDYMGSGQFQPTVAVSPDDIGILWTAAGGKDRLTGTSQNGPATPDVDEGTHVVPRS
jgi:hypothetical protein